MGQVLSRCSVVHIVVFNFVLASATTDDPSPAAASPAAASPALLEFQKSGVTNYIHGNRFALRADGTLAAVAVAAAEGSTGSGLSPVKIAVHGKKSEFVLLDVDEGCKAKSFASLSYYTYTCGQNEVKIGKEALPPTKRGGEVLELFKEGTEGAGGAEQEGPSPGEAVSGAAADQEGPSTAGEEAGGGEGERGGGGAEERGGGGAEERGGGGAEERDRSAEGAAEEGKVAAQPEVPSTQPVAEAGGYATTAF